MRNIWQEGFEIERNGEKILLTRQEIVAIRDLIDAYCGQRSIEFWLAGMKDIEEECLTDCDRKLMKIAEDQMENESVCLEIQSDFEDAIFEDSGQLELNTVKDVLSKFIEEE